MGFLYGALDSRFSRLGADVSVANLGGLMGFNLITGRTGDGSSDSRSLTSVLGMGESGFQAGRTSPGTVIRCPRGRDNNAVGARGGCSVRRCVDVPCSIFLPLRDLLTSGDSDFTGVGSREGGFGNACSLLMMLFSLL